MNREANRIPALFGSVSAWSGTKLSDAPDPPASATRRCSEARHSGCLIINADDWGRDRRTTGMIFDCILRGALSSVSAMVFMEDSERAAAIVRQRGIDAGLHLNFTTPFSAPNCPAGLVERQRELANHLLRHPIARAIFRPGLVRSFEYVVAAQLDEYRRLYQQDPDRLDGHHHMHLCANVLLRGLLPPGSLVRRHFSFEAGQKKRLRNWLYRLIADRILARRHGLVDFFYALPPLEPPGRLQRIFSLARQFVVELETHPVNSEEYRFLAGGGILRWAGDLPIAPHFAAPRRGRTSTGSAR